ncbi:MAG: glycosyltransferase family 4 protein [Verrucomicrobia bacterium]|nr:glycosyltransferase family 4 protein [Verrucomicrobiota bacterium]
MRVAIDLTALNPKPSGIDRYLEGLVASLAQLDADADWLLFINAEDCARFAAKRLPPRFRIMPVCFRPRLLRLLFQQLLQPLLLYAFRIDVLHSPTFIMPLWRGRARHVLTIHDMSSFVLPQSHPAMRRGPLYERAVSTCIRRADLVTVPSQSVKEDILRLVPRVHGARIRVIPCGVDDHFHPRDSAEVGAVLHRLNLPAPYILFVGTLDPRKNLPVLIYAYSQLVARQRPEHLVLAGQTSWSVDELSSSVASAAVSDRIHLPGYIADSDLPFVYAGAALFVYPSLLEGFGFPPLEAMASGVPVVASDTSSLRDNLAGTAILVPPTNSEAFAAAMETLLTDETARTQAITSGLERSRSFRWEAFARETLACYRALAQR